MFCSRCGTEVQDKSKFCPSCGLDLVAQTPLGRVSAEATSEKTEVDLVRDALKEEYEIIQELGRGGMAIVFKARDRHLDREVAIKVLPFSLAFDAEFVERFQREAKTSARLEHPNIIPIYRVGKSGRVIYFVMKFLRGSSLSEILEKKGALPPSELRQLLAQTASALGYAHQHGIVHRDIKPDNIMYDELGHAIVTDFGIAKAASGTKLTGTGMSIGTPHYMSPEQARAQTLDGRSDIYSLGVVAYQCLVGRVPFDGEDAFSIGYKHIMEELETPPLTTGDQREMFEVVRKMMAKSVDGRFQRAEDVVAVCQGRDSLFTSGADVASAPTVALPAMAEPETAEVPARFGAGALARPSTPTTPMPRAEPRRAPPKKKRRGGLIAASLILLFGGAGAGGFYYFFTDGPLPGWIPQRPLAAAPAEPSPIVPPPVDSAALALVDSTAADSATADSTPPAAVLPDSGWLVVRGAPRGARNYIDGNVAAANPARLAIGTYRLEVRATGFQSYSASVNIGRGDSLVQPVTLTRTPAPTMIVDKPVDTAATPPPAQPRAAAAAAAAATQCNSPTAPNYNSNRGCFDALPRFLGNPQVRLTAQVGQNPTPVTLWVQVSAEGKPVSRTAVQRSSDDAFTLLAMQYAMTQLYQAATKDGNPVQAWIQVRFFPAQR
ncbi:MAG TPA: protein kinase [Gemmatimonadales bacterium]